MYYRWDKRSLGTILVSKYKVSAVICVESSKRIVSLNLADKFFSSVVGLLVIMMASTIRSCI